jgi:hypothetical protein
MSDVAANGSKCKQTADELAKHFQISEPRWEKSRKRRPKYFSLHRQRWRDLQMIRQNRPLLDHMDLEVLQWVDAETAGNSLGLTAKERTMWNITTIRACDQEAAALRKAKKRERDRERQRQKRQPRAEYLAEHSISRSKPWEREGISRTTWYQRRTSASPTTSLSSCSATDLSIPFPPWTPDGPPVCTQLGYLLRLAQYRHLTSGGYVKAVPGLAACSELRRVA